MLLEYDGAAFHGWQIQPDRPTVQEAIESALEVVLKSRLSVTGSGRTDAGVHARGQVAHFDIDTEVDAYRMRRSLNGLLPRSVRVRYLEEARPDFHARYDARARRYHYYVCTVPTALAGHARWELRPVPDFGLMNHAASVLIGRHDFDAFCRVQSETHNRFCEVRHARWVPEPAAHPTPEIDSWRFEIVADRFLHGMVRAIVGTLIEIGRGKRPPDDLSRILASGDRREAGPAAPAHGLVLEHVLYDTPFRRP
jgi:tRNA pseudouridine38-40 synthase